MHSNKAPSVQNVGDFRSIGTFGICHTQREMFFERYGGVKPTGMNRFTLVSESDCLHMYFTTIESDSHELHTFVEARKEVSVDSSSDIHGARGRRVPRKGVNLV